MVEHPFPPLYDADSAILILGSFPSVRSREAMFFYGHPQNRFWKVISALLDEPLPVTTEEKAGMMHRHHIAMWDVLASCEIKGSADNSIRNATVNDLSGILTAADIRAIFCNGKTAYSFYRKYTQDKIGRSAFCLPSTSPANASFGMEELLLEWQIIRNYL